MSYCSECGTEITSEKFCSECGAKILSNSNETELDNTKKINPNLKSKFVLRKKAEKKGFYYINGHGCGNRLYMTNEGIETGDNQFIPYENIKSINGKTHTVKRIPLLYVFGLKTFKEGLALQTIKIKFIGGKVIIRDVKNDEAENFIIAVRRKITEITKNN